MKIAQIISLCILFITLQQCSKNTAINEPSELLNLHQDTAKIFVSDGVYLELKSLKDSYQIDENVIYNLKLVNESDTNGLPINTEDGYLNLTNSIRIYNEDGNYVYGGSFAKLMDTVLMPNQSFEWEYAWNQSDINDYGTNTRTHDFATFGLKVYAGKYYLKAQHYGNDLLENKFVTKWIEISEEGEALNGIALRYDNISTDSVKVDFIIRNRQNKALDFRLNSINSLEVFIGGGHPRYSWSSPPEHIDTIKLSFEQNKLIFQPKSDILICNYNISKNDPIYSDLKGDKELYFIIELEERNIYARTHVYF